jgi:hypothetical protein
MVCGFDSFMVLLFYVLYGFLVLWFYGFMVLWFYGFMVLGVYGFRGLEFQIYSPGFG